MSASKFAPEVRGALIERTAAGVSLADACRAVGVREATVKGWLTRGRREGDGEYADFAEATDARAPRADGRRGAGTDRLRTALPATWPMPTDVGASAGRAE